MIFMGISRGQQYGCTILDKFKDGTEAKRQIGYDSNGNKQALELHKRERIEQYKIALKQIAMRFYMTDISDRTAFGK